MKIKDKVRPKAPPVAPGVYIGICVGVIDLGEQYNEKYKKYSNEVQFVWELVGETVSINGEMKPRQLSRTFPVTASKKGTLRKFLSAWNGRQYTDAEFGELEMLDQLNRPCQLQVALNETGEYSNIENVMPVPKGFQVPVTNSALVRWDMDKWNDAVFEGLPDWVKGKIMKSTQYQKLHAPDEKVDFSPAGEKVEGAPAAGQSPTEEEAPPF